MSQFRSFKIKRDFPPDLLDSKRFSVLRTKEDTIVKVDRCMTLLAFRRDTGIEEAQGMKFGKVCEDGADKRKRKNRYASRAEMQELVHTIARMREELDTLKKK